MQQINDLHALEKITREGATVILFGGPRCAVCHNLRPKLLSLVEQNYPEMSCLYVDCEISPEICAQYSVFSLPVVKVYIEGMLITEATRVFSVTELMQRISRPYGLWCNRDTS